MRKTILIVFFVCIYAVISSLNVMSGFETKNSAEIVLMEEMNGTFLVEAEAGLLVPPISVWDDTTASGGKYVAVPRSFSLIRAAEQVSEIHARYNFEVKEKGQYIIWLKLKAPGTNADTYWVGIDDIGYSQVSVSVAPDWTWRKGLIYELEEGYHTVNLKYREAGCMLDQIMITNDLRYTPSGIEVLGGAKDDQNAVESNVLKVLVNGNRVNYDTTPVMNGNVIMAPVKATLATMGVYSELLGNTLTAAKERYYVKIVADEKFATVNGRSVEMRKPAYMVGVSLLAPLDFVAKSFGGTVEMIDEKTANIVVDLAEYIRLAKDDEINILAQAKGATFKIPYETDVGVKCGVWLKKKKSVCWEKTNDPVYIEGAFTGSFRDLDEDVEYEVKVRIYKDGKEDVFKSEFKSLDYNIFSLDGFLYKADELLVIPTFENISYYIDTENEDSVCEMQYREVDGQWRDVYPPVFDKNVKQFRGSIVNLKEDTEYEVKARITSNKKVEKEQIKTVRTWTSAPPIAKTIPISEIYKDGSLVLEGVKGSIDGWIKIIGDGETVISADDRYHEAVLIANSEYIILENLLVSGGRVHGINVTNNSSDIRIINCEITNWCRKGVQDLIYAVYKDYDGRYINQDAGVKISDTRNVVVERCYIHDPKGKANAWSGPTWLSAHPEGPNAVVCRGRGGVVIRYNDFIGSDEHRWNDAIESFNNGYPTGGPSKDADIYGNILAFGQDDGIELDGGQMNIRFYNNKIEGFLCGVSTAPNLAGPSYIFRNLITDLSDEVNKASSAIKNGGGQTHAYGRSYFFNNTFETPRGIKDIGYGNSFDRGRFLGYSLNNILVSVENFSDSYGVSDPYMQEENKFDYDLFGSRVLSGGVGRFVVRPGEEKNAVMGLPTYIDKDAGDYRLAQSSLGVDKGTVIPNFTEDYTGDAPDIGLFEVGDTHFAPYRPIDISADRYRFDFTPVKKTGEVTIKIGNIEEGRSFKLRKNDVFDWITVETIDGKTEGTLTPNSEIVLKVSVNQELIDYPTGKGAFTFRVDNGYSMPIMVYSSK